MIQAGDTIVVARFNEDLTWLANSDIAKYCVIYNKGKAIDNEMHTKFRDVFDIPNVGREAHTYLYHILSLYDFFKEKGKTDAVHVFIQGCISDHIPSTYKSKEIDFLKILCQEAHENGMSMNMDAHKVNKNSAIENFKISKHSKNVKLKDSEMTFGQWFRAFVCPDFVNPIKEGDVYWYKAALFAVKNHLICDAHQKDYYLNLIKNVDGDVNTECAHFFERSWFHIFANAEILEKAKLYKKK